VRVRCRTDDKPGSLIAGSMEDIPVEQAIITGVAHDRSEGKVTVTGVRTPPGTPRASSARWPTPRSTSTWSLQNISHAN